MLEVRNITKEFPGVRALDHVSVQFETGQIHALMGENGAGKSTLMKIITGIYQPDLGEVCIDGEPVHFKSYRDSVAHDISIVHQEIQVIPEATVAENIVLDKLDSFRSRLGRLDWKRINATAQKYLQIVELDVAPTQIIKGMTAAQKQLIQIAKALSADARYILLDEPTSSLTRYEAENLFRILNKLRDNGCGIIFVSHKIEEIMSLCDCVTVLRDGKAIGTKPIREITRAELVHMMIGREENVEYLGRLNISDEVVLEARDIGKAGMFSHMNMQLRRGEILGLYGLVGAGRTEFARLLVGVEQPDTGAVYLNGQKAQIRSLADAVYRYKMSYVSENRKEEGLILPFSVQDNVTLTALGQLKNKLGAISYKRAEELTGGIIDRLELKTPSQQTPVESLSGGNQQKVSIGKWLLAGSDILIIDEPTIGVDIGAKYHIHKLIWDLAEKQGKSIILISSDMTEMVTLARRILVFKDYQIVDEIDGLNDREHSYQELSERIGQAVS